mmetsp:Transcript_86402/g.241707  ORF Transcript_86402/g.241707 Transcript_86402/m.241707 type:complete len:242 (+) Transcript_86402:919-1644(+)
MPDPKPKELPQREAVHVTLSRHHVAAYDRPQLPGTRHQVREQALTEQRRAAVPATREGLQGLERQACVEESQTNLQGLMRVDASEPPSTIASHLGVHRSGGRCHRDAVSRSSHGVVRRLSLEVRLPPFACQKRLHFFPQLALRSAGARGSSGGGGSGGGGVADANCLSLVNTGEACTEVPCGLPQITEGTDHDGVAVVDDRVQALRDLLESRSCESPLVLAELFAQLPGFLRRCFAPAEKT